MAKRRRLEAPSAAELDKLEAEFRGETPDARRAPPIAQVARETAAALDFSGADAGLVASSKDAEDAARLRDAEQNGLLMLDLPLAEIDLDSMIRDRTVLDQDAMRELEESILKNGLRMPIEVYHLPKAARAADATGGQGPRFGLLSGYRRLYVVRALHKKLGAGHFETIRAILRKPETDADRFSAMVEENEVRQQLSHFERGRICALSAQQGIFANTEAAVAALYPVASKAKRSKIRSFALIFEEIGDVLNFPEMLKEKDGLRIAAALRDGHEDRLRQALENSRAGTPAEEWNRIAATLDTLEAGADRAARGGRPRAKLAAPGWDGDVLRLSSGFELRKSSDAKGYIIHISGRNLTPAMLEELVDRVAYLLDDSEG